MFKLHHIQSAVSCITGVQIHPFQITNTMMGNECPVSLAFEGDKVVVVNNGQVVFYTTTKEYSADVQKFLDITRALRNTRKDVKGMEKQLKVYSAPDLPDGDKLPSLLSEEQQKDPICVGTLKRGDLVKLRDGTKLCVSSVTYTEYAQYPYRVHFTTGTSKTYLEDGRYSLASKTTEYDIVEVIHK